MSFSGPSGIPKRFYASSTENRSSSSASIPNSPNSPGYDGGHSSASSLGSNQPRKRFKRDKKVPYVTVTFHDATGVVRKSLNLDIDLPLEPSIESFKNSSANLIRECWEQINPTLGHNASHSSSDSFNRSNAPIPSSTPRHPLKPPLASGSDSDLFKDTPERGSAQSSNGSNGPLLPPNNSSSGSADLFKSDQGGDEADTQDPYLNPDILRNAEPLELLQVSDSDEDEQLSVSFNGPIKNSLGIEYGKDASVVGAQECTQEDTKEPQPDAFEGLKVVLTCEEEGLNKHYYTKLVELGGGEVLDDIPLGNKENTVIVSDRPCRTPSFLHALLLGIPCVEKIWLDRCVENDCSKEQCRIEKIHSAYFLKRGTDFLTNKPVTQRYQPQKWPIPQPFTGQIVYLQGTNTFKDAWQDIVKSGGGSALKRWFKSTSCIPTVVASDNTKKRSKTTLDFGKPIVSPEWLIQCVVTGKLAEFAPFEL